MQIRNVAGTEKGTEKIKIKWAVNLRHLKFLLKINITKSCKFQVHRDCLRHVTHMKERSDNTSNRCKQQEAQPSRAKWQHLLCFFFNSFFTKFERRKEEREKKNLKDWIRARKVKGRTQKGHCCGTMPEDDGFVVHVLYGSQTGNSQAAAKEIGERLGCQVFIMDDYLQGRGGGGKFDRGSADFYVVVVSSYGVGQVRRREEARQRDPMLPCRAPILTFSVAE